MRNLTLVGLAFILFGAASSVLAQSASLNGFVRDASTGETLLLANVILEGTTVGAATNTSGYYTLTGLDPGEVTILCSYIGYTPRRVTVTLAADEHRRLDIELDPANISTQEIVVSAEREVDEELRSLGAARINTEVIRQLPTLLEPDVFRSIQLLPGVKAASDYSSGLYIRGGSPDQTLILLDRTTVYNPTHFFGFFSTFNPDAIKDVRLYKGGFPAEYGGRIGSVVDIYNKDGNRRETHGRVSLGLLASRAMVEGPYKWGSWMLAVRRSTLEPLLSAMRRADVEGIPDKFYFLDVNGKVNLDLTPNDQVSLAFYAGRDLLDIEFLEDARIDLLYGNTTVSGTWTHIFSDRLFSNVTATASRYFSDPRFEIATTVFERENDLYDVSAKGDFEYIAGAGHSLHAGFWTGNFTFRLKDNFDDIETFNERLQTAYTSVFLQDTYRPASNWMIKAGLRGNFFGEGDFIRFGPRLSIEYKPADALRLQLGAGRYYQFLTLVTSELFSGFDFWLTTGDGVEPAFGDQVVGGIKTMLGNGIELDTEVYYRTMRSLFQLDPFLPDAAGLDYADLFHFGRGYATGSEIELRKTRGRLKGFVGYTLAHTRRQFPSLNQNEPFPPKYDRTHDLKLVANLDLTRKWRLTGVFTYATGQAYTEPQSQYKLLDNPFSSQIKDVLISPFNSARLPAYHRLDLGASKIGKFFGLGDYELQLQVLNAYKRRNIWFYFFEFEDDNTITREEAPQIPIPIPNVSFTLKF